MVMEEMEAPRPTHILLRGQYDQPGKAIDPAVPGFISKWNEDYWCFSSKQNVMNKIKLYYYLYLETVRFHQILLW